jgi:arsenate reductase
MLSEEDRIHLHLYGLKNCDSCRSTRRWLEMRRVPYTFHDVREEGLDATLLKGWLASAHAPYLVNRNSTTWRQLDEAQRQRADSDPAKLLLEHPTLLKRPVVTDGAVILEVGFNPGSLEDYI